MHFNKKWQDSTAIMGPYKSFNTFLICWFMLVDAITYMFKDFMLANAEYVLLKEERD